LTDEWGSLMGNCIYCEQPVGFLSKQHKDCRERHDQAAREIPQFFVKALRSPIEPARFRTMIEQISHNNFVTESEHRQLVFNGLRRMVNSAFADRLLTEEEEQRITVFCNTFDVAANELGDPKMRLAKAQILRRLDEGKFPEKIRVDGLPINLEHNETAVWLFKNVNYYTMRERTEYVATSHGIPIRLLRGIYYRVGAFKGEPIKTENLAEDGQGALLLTSHNAYFWSPKKVIQLPIKEIVSLYPHSDGIQIIRDIEYSGPQIFKVDDPLFACDAISRLVTRLLPNPTADLNSVVVSEMTPGKTVATWPPPMRSAN
jgi:hypothetical protein